MNHKISIAIIGFFIALMPMIALAQPILIDEGIRVNEVWCFPVLGQPHNYKYLPMEVALREANGKPQFSFLKYIINTEGSAEVTKALTKATGGAIVNFVVELKSDAQQIKKAEAQLKQKFGQALKITGPIIPEKGTFMLVSSILNSQGKKENKVVGLSNAPVLEGGSIPASFRLAEEDALLLLESFKMSTPDISLIFDFTIKGLTQSFEGEINYNWSQIYKYARSKEKVGQPFFKVEIDKLNEELSQQDFIEIITNGDDQQMEQLQQIAFDKITSMLFKPVNLSDFREKKSWAKELSSAAGEIIGMVNPGLLSIGYTSSYQFRSISKTGTGHIKLKGRATTERSHFITFNIGNLYEQYGQDSTVFRTANLFDTDFLQREVFIGVDVSLTNEFDKMLNNITIEFRKKHQDGRISVDQKVLHKMGDVDLKDIPKIVYPNLKDKDLLEWLNYDYRATWYFQGGAKIKQDWETTNAAMINLYTPYEQKEIQLGGTLETVWEKGVEAIIVEFSHDFFGQQITKKQIIQKGDNLKDKQFEITYPLGKYEGNYKVIWLTADEPIVRTGTDKYGLIFIDKVAKN
ncbi:MAG: hypothetical protein ACI85O_000676 [Saprospiraceae bacterium]|jgi:hypothetical protein